jgi:hypothetical protein
MSITVTMTCLQEARTASTPAERLGFLATAQEALKAAIKSARQASLEEAAGQESLPIDVGTARTR